MVSYPSGVSSDTSLYQIMCLDYLLSMLKNDVNTLVRPYSWDDIYEKHLGISSITVHKKGEKDELFRFNKQQWFAQCWSLTKESDVLWKTFAPKHEEKRYVKIKTTWKSLLDSMTSSDDSHLSIVVLDKVKYVKQDKKKYNKNIMHVYRKYSSEIKSTYDLLYLGLLLTKREAFKHENEVRLLVDLLEDNSDYITIEKGKEFLKWPIRDMQSLIKSIELDPWVEDEEAEEVTEKLQGELKGRNIPICVSPLRLQEKDTEKYHYHVCLEPNDNELLYQIAKLQGK